MTNLFGTAEAEAARQLFYFMASRAGVDEDTIERAWQGADLGLDFTELRSAIGNAARARASLTEKDQKRWGLYSIQRLFLTFLEEAGIGCARRLAISQALQKCSWEQSMLSH